MLAEVISRIGGSTEKARYEPWNFAKGKMLTFKYFFKGMSVIEGV